MSKPADVKTELELDPHYVPTNDVRAMSDRVNKSTLDFLSRDNKKTVAEIQRFYSNTIGQYKGDDERYILLSLTRSIEQVVPPESDINFAPDGRPEMISSAIWNTLPKLVRQAYSQDIKETQGEAVRRVRHPEPIVVPVEQRPAVISPASPRITAVPTSPRVVQVPAPQLSQSATDFLSSLTIVDEKPLSYCEVSIDRRLEVFLARNSLIPDKSGVTTYALSMTMVAICAPYNRNATNIAKFSDYKFNVAHSFRGKHLLDFESKNPDNSKNLPVDNSEPNLPQGIRALGENDFKSFDTPTNEWFMSYFFSGVCKTQAIGLLGTSQIRDLKPANLDNFQKFEGIKFDATVIIGVAKFLKEMIPKLQQAEMWRGLVKRNNFYEYHSKSHSAGSLILGFVQENPPRVSQLVPDSDLHYAKECEKYPWDLTLANYISSQTKALVYCWGEANDAQWVREPNVWWMGKRAANSLPVSKKNFMIKAFKAYNRYREEQLDNMSKITTLEPEEVLARALEYSSI